MRSSICYFSLDAPTEYPSGDESDASTIKPRESTPLTPMTLGSAVLSPGSIERPSFNHFCLDNAFRRQSHSQLTPPLSPTSRPGHHPRKVSFDLASLRNQTRTRPVFPKEQIEMTESAESEIGAGDEAVSAQTTRNNRDSWSRAYGSGLSFITEHGSELHDSSNSATNTDPARSTDTASTHRPTRTHNVHAPVYNRAANALPDASTQSLPKPRGRARLQSLFKRSATEDSEVTTTAGSLGLHLETSSANLSFLPSEAKKLATPPASAEPRLNPFNSPVNSPARSKSPNTATRSPLATTATSTTSPAPATRAAPLIRAPTIIPDRRSSLADPAHAAQQEREADDMFRSTWGPSSNAIETGKMPPSSSSARISWIGNSTSTDATDSWGASQGLTKSLANIIVDAIPEHLPTSPLCPKHPKHRSGGSGICPYHGG